MAAALALAAPSAAGDAAFPSGARCACGRRGAEARPMPANSEGVIEDPEEESESSSEETRPNELLMAGGTSSEPGGDASALAGEAGFGVGFCGLAFFGLFCGLSAFTAGLRALAGAVTARDSSSLSDAGSAGFAGGVAASPGGRITRRLRALPTAPSLRPDMVAPRHRP